jgi:hypothetical protein
MGRATGYNTGFLILRGGDRAERLIQDWLDCPDKVGRTLLLRVLSNVLYK